MEPFAETFLFGLVNSLHCAGMCGPLAAAFAVGARPSAGGVVLYHGGRAAGYTGLGVALGAGGAGLGLGQALGSGGLAFVLAGLLVFFAFGGEALLSRGSGLGRWGHALYRRCFRLPARVRAAGLGLLTPLLPCGLLYAAYAAAAAAGSAGAGALAMGGFALGSLPLLLVAQTQLVVLQRRLGPGGMVWVRRGAMLLAAGVLAWRGWNAAAGAACH